MTYELLASTGPQPPIYKSKEGHDICEFKAPINFTCILDGGVLTASLTHAEADTERWLYHITFSNGYKGIFTISKKQRCIIEKGHHAPSAYAKAIAADIETIYQFNPLQVPPFCLSVNVDEAPVKVWAKMEGKGCWFVYFNGGPKFFLHFFTGSWQPEPLDNMGGYVVPAIANAVTERLKGIIKFVAVNAPSNN